MQKEQTYDANPRTQYRNIKKRDCKKEELRDAIHSCVAARLLCAFPLSQIPTLKFRPLLDYTSARETNEKKKSVTIGVIFV